MIRHSICALMFCALSICALMFCALSICGCRKASETKSQSLNREAGKAAAASASLKRPIEATAFYGVTDAWIITGKKDLLHTHDGVTWEQTGAICVGGFECVTFIDEDRGWTANDRGLVWSTQDGGRTWKVISSIGHGEGFAIEQIKFTDEHNGWISDPFSIWRTTDGGVSWKQREYDTPIALACFVNGQGAWIFDQDNRFFFNSFPGENMSEVRHVPGKSGDGDLRAVYCLSEKTVWLTRGKGWPDFGDSHLYRTEDGGKSWLMREIPGNKTDINAVYFLDETEGWVAGSEKINGLDLPDSFAPILLHTINGGQTWEEQGTGVQDIGYDEVYFLDAFHGWLRGYDKVYRTDNGGANWIVVLNIER